MKSINHLDKTCYYNKQTFISIKSTYKESLERLLIDTEALAYKHTHSYHTYFTKRKKKETKFTHALPFEWQAIYRHNALIQLFERIIMNDDCTLSGGFADVMANIWSILTFFWRW